MAHVTANNDAIDALTHNLASRDLLSARMRLANR
jgi:hypothetical protein